MRTVTALGLLLLLCVIGRPFAAQPSPGQPRRHALLIGVTTYSNLDKRFDLEGPINDVALVRATLQERVRFRPEDIVELTETSAAGRPTRANIEREFARLAKAAGRGDLVFILFAGHGSQQPDHDKPGQDESDGLDEIILPADTAGWDSQTELVRNAITDDEIRAWLTAIRARGASVFIVFDSCQSSSMTRGVETYRRVRMRDLVPVKALTAVPTGTSDPEVESNVIGLGADAGGLAALYAAQTTEPTPEKPMPDDKGPVHGLFTYTLMEVLSQSATAISYRDLAEGVVERYRTLGRLSPTPGFEGGALDEPVLDMARWAGRPSLTLEAGKDGRVTLRAGAIQGLTPGTILRVFPPPGSQDADQLLGHVRVSGANATSATLEPAAFGDALPPPAARLVSGSRAEVAQYDYGDNVLKVALHPEPAMQGTAGLAMVRALDQLSKTTNGMAQRVTSVSAADWIVSATGDDVVLGPASGWRVNSSSGANANDQAPFRIGRATAPDFADRLTRAAGQIARVRGLLTVAGSRPAAAADLGIELELIRYRDAQDTQGTIVASAPGGRILHPGDQIAFRFRNNGKTDADVTLLFIDSQYGIEAIFPRQDAESDSRVAKDQTTTTPRFTVNDDTLGAEQVVAIAVEAAAIRTDFRYLAQRSLETSATRGERSRSPLQQLFDRSVFGAGTTRGPQDGEVGRYEVEMLAWTTQRR
jgi:hypothetical protein